MANGALTPVRGLFSSPASILFVQLCSGSAVLGCTEPKSWVRPLMLPVASACVYRIVQSSTDFMRARYASLLGGLSFCFFMQFLDMALISRWSFETHGPASMDMPSSYDKESVTDQSHGRKGSSFSGKRSLWDRLSWGWNTLWSFRHVDTPYEAGNTPPFSEKDPSYVPSRPAFLTQRAAIAGACYLVLDLLTARPPANKPALFSPALIPFFRRLNEVTLAQVKVRAFSIAGFAVTFYCIISGFHSALAAVSVGLGLSEPRSWRPPFGSFSKAYSLQNLWGKVWHQNLRRQITSPANYITQHVLRLPSKSIIARYMTILLSFAVSGIMHTAAGVATGASLKELGVFQFFCTQAFGVIVEDATQALYVNRTRKTGEKGHSQRGEPSWQLRCLGYAWVAAYMAWSGPIWLYPQASRTQQKGPNSFVPYSIVRALRARL